MGRHISQLTQKIDKITYWRRPTTDEIRFGHGAIHYRDFDLEICFNEDGFQKPKIKAADDQLIYYCT